MTFARGDRVLLIDVETGHSHLIVLDGGGARKEKGLGVFDPARVEGSEEGTQHVFGTKTMVALRPTQTDAAATLRRKAQIITPKDLARILHHLALGPGDRVLESGIGSGAATMHLAHAVGPDGEVVVQELREDFRDWAMDNLQRAGLDGPVTCHIGDLTKEVAVGVEGPFDAVLLDQPEPWLAVPHIVSLLRPGARLVGYCPQVSQMERMVRALDGWLDVRALEVMEREWVTKEHGSRPSFDGLGHTAFLVLARHA